MNLYCWRCAPRLSVQFSSLWWSRLIFISLFPPQFIFWVTGSGQLDGWCETGETWFVKLIKKVRSASNPDLTSSVCILSVDMMWFGCFFGFFYSFFTGTSILQACPMKLGHSIEEGRRWWWGNTTETASLVKLNRVFPEGEKRTKIWN